MAQQILTEINWQKSQISNNFHQPRPVLRAATAKYNGRKLCVKKGTQCKSLAASNWSISIFQKGA